jgi:hypothetical protein
MIRAPLAGLGILGRLGIGVAAVGVGVEAAVLAGLDRVTAVAVAVIPLAAELTWAASVVVRLLSVPALGMGVLRGFVVLVAVVLVRLVVVLAIVSLVLVLVFVGFLPVVA